MFLQLRVNFGDLKTSSNNICHRKLEITIFNENNSKNTRERSMKPNNK